MLNWLSETVGAFAELSIHGAYEYAFRNVPNRIFDPNVSVWE